MSDDAFEEVAVEFEPETGAYLATFDSAAVEPSTAVVETMADVLGRDPTDLAPLFEVVDPQALDRLCARRVPHREGDRTVAFTYLDHEVTVKSLGTIRVRPLEEADGGDEDAGDDGGDEGT